MRPMTTHPVHTEGPYCVVGQLLCVNKGDCHVTEADAAGLWPVLVAFRLLGEGERGREREKKTFSQLSEFLGM